MRNKELYSCKMMCLVHFQAKRQMGYFMKFSFSCEQNAVDKENVDKNNHSEISGTNHTDEAKLRTAHHGNPCQT